MAASARRRSILTRILRRQDSAEAPLRPSDARFDNNLQEFILEYDAVRTADNPDDVLLDFFQSTYEAAANAASWDRAALERQLT